jgi:hypothetical protein
MKVTTGSGATGTGRVLGVNSGRGAGFGVLGICQFNTAGASGVPSSDGDMLVDWIDGESLTPQRTRLQLHDVA